MVIYYAFALAIILGIAYFIYGAIYFYSYIKGEETIEVRSKKKTKEKLLRDIEKFGRKSKSSRMDPQEL